MTRFCASFVNRFAVGCFLSLPKTDIWHNLATALHDPALRSLASVSLPYLLMSAKASSTTNKYLASWKRWEEWASSKSNVPIFPVSSFHFSIYIAHLATTGLKSVADSTTAAVKWVHSLANLPSPTDSIMAKTALQGFKRLNATPTTRKEPITPDILEGILASHGHSSANLADLRLLFICFVAYAGFLRLDDLSKITRKNCTFTSDRLTIHLPSSKADQFRQGSDIVIARTFKSTCPVSIAERYFAALGDPPDCQLPAVRRLQRKRTGLFPTKHALSYTRTREILLDALKPLVPNITSYGIHSLRSGGASAAFNAQVPPILISKQGRWKSEKARDTYLKADTTTSLLASKSVGV